MPGKKKKSVSPVSIRFIYSDNRHKTYIVDELAFDEKQVIKGSITFFGDPEPCMIHKGAVITRYIGEIHNWLQTIDLSAEYHISFFPEAMLRNIDQSIVKDAQRFAVISGDAQ